MTFGRGSSSSGMPRSWSVPVRESKARLSELGGDLTPIAGSHRALEADAELAGRAGEEEEVCDVHQHDPRDHPDPSADRGAADVAVQLRLGLLPERWPRLVGDHPDHLVAAGTYLTVCRLGLARNRTSV